MKKEILEMLNDFSKEEIEDFVANVEQESLFYYIMNYSCVIFSNHATYKKYLNEPFLVASNFLVTLERMAYDYLDN